MVPIIRETEEDKEEAEKVWSIKDWNPDDSFI